MEEINVRTFLEYKKEKLKYIKQEFEILESDIRDLYVKSVLDPAYVYTLLDATSVNRRACVKLLINEKIRTINAIDESFNKAKRIIRNVENHIIKLQDLTGIIR